MKLQEFISSVCFAGREPSRKARVFSDQREWQHSLFPRDSKLPLLLFFNFSSFRFYTLSPFRFFPHIYILFFIDIYPRLFFTSFLIYTSLPTYTLRRFRCLFLLFETITAETIECNFILVYTYYYTSNHDSLPLCLRSSLVKSAVVWKKKNGKLNISFSTRCSRGCSPSYIFMGLYCAGEYSVLCADVKSFTEIHGK